MWHGLLGTDGAHDGNLAAVAEDFGGESGCGLRASRPTSAEYGNGSCRETRSCVQRTREWRCNEPVHAEIDRPKFLETATTLL